MIDVKSVLRVVRFFPIFLILCISNFSYSEKYNSDYFLNNGDYLDVKISPDGKTLAARLRQGDDMILAFVDVATGKPTGSIRAANGDVVYNYNWVSNERVAYQFARKVAWFHVPVSFGMWAINKDNSQRKPIYGLDSRQTGTRLNHRKAIKASISVLDILDDDEDNVLIVEHPLSRMGNEWHDLRNIAPSIAKINVNTGKRYKVETLPSPGAMPVAAKGGAVNFYTLVDKNTDLQVFYRSPKAPDWKQAHFPTVDVERRVVAVSNDSQKIYLLARDPKTSRRTLFEWSVGDGSYVQLFETGRVDVDNFIWDPKTGEPVAAIIEPSKYQYIYLDAPFAKFHKMLTRAFKGQRVGILDSSDNGKNLVVFVDSDVNPGEYYLFNSETKKAAFLMAARSWINPDLLQGVIPLEVSARDGLSISGYLTPAKGTAKAAPMVVVPHGGPHGVRDYWKYNGEAQLLAHNGYNVLQVNFRGSGGYGSNFESAGYGQWGKAMITDVIDATQAMITQGYAKADNICMYGASYGGFSSLMAAASEPDLFQCAVGYVGVYDLKMMFESGDIPEMRTGPGYLARVLGTDPVQWKEQSPVYNADKIKAKVLLIHGSKDRRAPIEHSKSMRQALERAGNKPEWMVQRTGHGAWTDKDRNAVYGRVLKFLEENLK